MFWSMPTLYVHIDIYMFTTLVCGYCFFCIFKRMILVNDRSQLAYFDIHHTNLAGLKTSQILQSNTDCNQVKPTKPSLHSVTCSDPVIVVITVLKSLEMNDLTQANFTSVQCFQTIQSSKLKEMWKIHSKLQYRTLWYTLCL